MNISKNKKGFTLIETVVYLFITSILLIVISSLIFNIFNTRRNINNSNIVHSDARYIMNFLYNNMHNIDLIDEVASSTEKYHFYKLPDKRFSLEVLDGDLVYRLSQDTGSGFPPQASSTPVKLNTDKVTVRSFVMNTYDDNDGNENRAATFSVVLSAGNSATGQGYVEKLFTTFISLR